MARSQNQTDVTDLFDAIHDDAKREMYAQQLRVADAPLKRIKLKLFGDSNAGKTRLLGVLQTGLITNLFNGISRRFSDASHHSKTCTVHLVV